MASVFLDALSIQPDFRTMSGLYSAIEDDSFTPTLIKENFDGRILDRIALQKSGGEFWLLIGSKRFDFVYQPYAAQQKYMSFDEFCDDASMKLTKALSFFERRSHRLTLAREVFFKSLPASKMDDVRDRLMIFPQLYADSKPFEWDWRCASNIEKEIRTTEDTNFITTLRRRLAVETTFFLQQPPPLVEESGSEVSQSTSQLGATSTPFDQLKFDFDINTSGHNLTPRFTGEDVQIFIKKCNGWHEELMKSVFDFLEVE